MLGDIYNAIGVLGANRSNEKELDDLPLFAMHRGTAWGIFKGPTERLRNLEPSRPAFDNIAQPEH